jgi:hypothetical protein
METLPTSFIINLPLKDLLYLCQTNSRINSLCQNEFLWMSRVQKEFPLDDISLPFNTSWKQFYIDLYEHSYPINVFLNNKFFLNGRFHDIHNLKERIQQTFKDYAIILFTDSGNKTLYFITPDDTTFYLVQRNNLGGLTNIYIYTYLDPELSQRIDQYSKVLNNYHGYRPGHLSSLKHILFDKLNKLILV